MVDYIFSTPMEVEFNKNLDHQQHQHPKFESSIIPSKSSSFPSSATPSPCPLTKLIVSWYRLGEYLLFVPFTMKTDQHQVLLSRSKLFQILVFIQQSILVLACITYLNFHPKFTSHNQIMDKFTQQMYVASSYLWTLNLLVLFWNLWTIKSRGQLTSLLRQMDQIHENFERLGVQMPGRREMMALSLFFVLYFLLWDCLESAQSLGLDTNSIFEGIHALAGYTQQWPTPQLSSIFGIENGKIFSNFCHTLYLTLVTWGLLIMDYATHYADLICLINATILYILCGRFVTLLQLLSHQKPPRTNQEKQVNEAMQMFAQLYQLNETINREIGSLVFCACFGRLPYYAVKVRTIFDGDPMLMAQVISYLLNLGLILILAAEANSKLHTFTAWLHHNHRRLRIKDDLVARDLQWNLMLVVNQLQKNELGLKGNCFTITYGIVGNMTGLVITYSIIIFQLQSK